MNIPKFSLKDDRHRLILGITAVAMSVFFFLSFFSFLFTWSQDQSVLDNNLIHYLGDKDIVVENWGGKIGALVAKKFIHDWFGISSFSFVLVFFIIGTRLLKMKILPLLKTIRLSLIITILSSLFFGYIFRSLWDGNMGGAHGYFVSRWLISTVGEFGTGVLVLALVLSFVVFTFENSVAFFYSLLPIKHGEKESTMDAAEGVYLSPVEDISDDDDEEDDDDDEEDDDLGDEDVCDSGLDEVELTDDIVPEIDKDIEFSGKPTHEYDDLDFELVGTNDPAAIHPSGDEQILEETLIGETPVTIATNKPDEKAYAINDDFLGDFDPTLELARYKLPPLDLLLDHSQNNSDVSEEELRGNLDKIVETLKTYKIDIAKIKATIGPTVTLYEIVPAPGIRISKIKNLEDDIALSLAALGIRIIAPIPGKGTIGIEVPNKNPQIVSMRSILETKVFQDTRYDLPIALGKTISNETYVVDLCKMPHLLVAGSTGQGKSVGLNAIMASLLYKKHPSQIKFVLVDPKKVELTLYTKIENHFLAKLPDTEEAIITDTTKVVHTLSSLCIEMDTRYDLMKAAKLRNIKEYNAKFIKRQLNPEEGHRFLPYIIVVIDEFADLIMTAGKEVELPIARLAQLARAIGIHLIIATQRPTTNIITGMIKANFPARIAFRVTSGTDSRTILDSTGANQLIGRGDMLISNGSDMVRVQCAFIDTPEIEKLTDFIADQQGYGSALMLPEYVGENGDGGPIDVDLGKKDSMFDEAARLLVASQQGSTSLIQRKFSIGYNRAGRIMDQLEAAGIVGPQEGSKTRQVLIVDPLHLEQILSTLNS